MKITLTSIENKIAKSGAPFSVVKDTNGETYTVWKDEISKKLVFGQPIDLIIKEANGFKNIRGIVGEDTEVKEEKIVNTLPSPQIQVEINKPRSNRYAKEIGGEGLTKQRVKVFLKADSNISWEEAGEMIWNSYEGYKNKLDD